MWWVFLPHLENHSKGWELTLSEGPPCLLTWVDGWSYGDAELGARRKLT